MKHNIYQPSDPSLAPGEARCPGPTVQELIASDKDRPPTTLLTQSYEFLGDEDVPLSVYTSQEQYDLEMQNLWTKTWQWAVREEQIPNPGDYTVYDIGQYSILIVRDEKNRINAYVNSCPHRGMQFCDSGSSGSGKQFLRCPFHGMSWNLDGSLREIPCRWDFPHIVDDEFGLTKVQCDSWGGFVFVNLDPNAQSLQDFLQILPEHFEQTPLEQRYVSLHTQKILPGNWKMCMEGFMEAYHVLATHPEGLRSSSWANTQYDLLSPHVSRFIQPLTGGNPHHHQSFSEAQRFALLGYDPDSLPSDKTARQQHAGNLRQQMGAQFGVDLSAVSNSVMLDSIEYHLFPNACFFPGVVIPLIYRFRPLGIDRCIHDIMLLTPVPDSGERPQPAATEYLDIDEPYVSLASFRENRLAAVLDQDTDNFKRQWAGMNASLKGTQTLGNYQEARIRHFHHALGECLR